ncbi:hypothetical protein [Phenylobacterium sp.]|jgi:hypothetical protein|uniref:hypothetical protein n=1 Tax=Phenylobacterium sp. TaxID=1871053 RepID=UPI002E358E65|nr:hypothetical protein [Phenylobacterium sp.]HEX3364589.1 hypothetical protein [Phenylobacterium sp.]
MRSALLLLVLAAFCANPGPSEAKSRPTLERTRALPSLCHPPEVALFQCAVGAKQLAICAADAPGTAQYRYGVPGKVELAYPAAPQAGPSPLKWATTGYSGGGETQVSFENAGVTYIIYSRMVRTGFGKDGHHNPQDELGVAALKGAKLLSNRRCRAAKIEGGHDDWIDEQRAKQLLLPGPFVDIPE